MDDSQHQGKEEVLEQIKQQEETLKERSETVDSRLNSFFEKKKEKFNLLLDWDPWLL